jgi:hypothetical protein
MAEDPDRSRKLRKRVSRIPEEEKMRRRTVAPNHS